MHDDEEVQEFVEGIYSDMEEQLNDIYRQKKESRDELLQTIGMIILTYTVIDAVLSLSESEYNSRYKLLSTLIVRLVRKDMKLEKDIARDIVTKTVKNTFKFYSYNADFKDVEKIINDNFKGKHFSDRIWNNEQNTAKKLNKLCQDFLKGKINVNQIEKVIKETYNSSSYNAKRLVETEVSKCHSDAFIKFCKETGVKRIKYNSVLDKKTCEDCKEYHGNIYNLGKEPYVPRHPLCRCYYDIIE